MVEVERDSCASFASVSFPEQSQEGVYRNRRVELDGPVDWPEGTKLVVTPVLPPAAASRLDGHVIIVGFGLPGRCVADLLDRAKLSYTIIEKNPVTVETQRALGRDVREGSGTDAETLVKAGLNSASILALTIPDEEGVLQAISLARRLRPEIYIIARTNYSSKGMKASQLGADDVIKAEQAVALQFYEKLSRRICRKA
jgi:CPA2 family monovalent cation:H+ antiporter-2